MFPCQFLLAAWCQRNPLATSLSSDNFINTLVFDNSTEQSMILEISALIIAFGTIAAVAVWTVATGSPPTPTSPQVRRAMLAILPPRLPGPNCGRIYELGSGWGGLSRALADRFPGQPVVGIELSPLPFLVARARNLIIPKQNLTLQFGSFLNADISDAALVVCYLSPNVLMKLRLKMERELASDTLVLSNTFGIPEWKPVATGAAPDMYRSLVYLYERSGAVAPSSQDRVAESTNGPTA